MAFNKEIFELAKYAAQGKGYVANADTFSAQDVKTSLREELKKYVGDFYSFQKNKYDLYELIAITVDEIVPERVITKMGRFAEIINLPQGARATFKRKLGRVRARQFIGRVSPAGIYETFRLDNDTFEIPVDAFGGGIRIDWERFLDGTEDWSELVDIVIDSIEEAVYQQVADLMVASFDASGRPENTIHSASAFDPAEMRKVMTTIRSYGDNVTIFATPQFVDEMGDAIVYGTGTPNASVTDIEDLRSKGYIGMFSGAPIVLLPNPFTDETNTETQLDSNIAFVMPSGKERVVKVAFEGGTIVNDFGMNPGDYSMEMMIYKKFGTGILYTHNWGGYRITV